MEQTAEELLKLAEAVEKQENRIVEAVWRAIVGSDTPKKEGWGTDHTSAGRPGNTVLFQIQRERRGNTDNKRVCTGAAFILHSIGRNNATGRYGKAAGN